MADTEHTGLSFSQSLVESMGPFLRALVGPSRLVTGDS